MTSRNLRKIAADSNVLLSAIIGKAALKVFIETNIEIVTTEFNIKEVIKYIPHFSAKYKIAENDLLLQLRMLPLLVFKKRYYNSKLSLAKSYLDARDPDDAHLAALALKENIPVWSNDKDFSNLPIDVYSTKKLLDALNL